jgi:hypothetical protein
MEVLHIDILVWCRFALAPQQQPLLCSHFLNRDVLDGKPQNDGPNHAQCHFQVPINNLCNRITSLEIQTEMLIPNTVIQITSTAKKKKAPVFHHLF